VNTEDVLVERLAHFAHSVWANWAWYMLSHNDAEHQDRWRRQAHTNYEALPDAEQESDRAIAREWLDEIGYDDLAAAVRAEREQVAELETDAKLGRTVREMPVYSLLCHESHWLGEWHAVWPGDNLHYNKQYGPTPEAALEAARKEET